MGAEKASWKATRGGPQAEASPLGPDRYDIGGVYKYNSGRNYLFAGAAYQCEWPARWQKLHGRWVTPLVSSAAGFLALC